MEGAVLVLAGVFAAVSSLGGCGGASEQNSMLADGATSPGDAGSADGSAASGGGEWQSAGQRERGLYRRNRHRAEGNVLHAGSVWTQKRSRRMRSRAHGGLRLDMCDTAEEHVFGRLYAKNFCDPGYMRERCLYVRADRHRVWRGDLCERHSYFCQHVRWRRRMSSGSHVELYTRVRGLSLRGRSMLGSLLRHSTGGSLRERHHATHLRRGRGV